MDYKLAKQLKEAGYPHTTGQNDKNIGGRWEHIKDKELTREMTHEEQTVYIPPLSELIDACGSGFVLERFDQYRKKTWWRAKAIFGTGEGKTPEEAVAKLYLALKKDG